MQWKRGKANSDTASACLLIRVTLNALPGLDWPQFLFSTWCSTIDLTTTLFHSAQLGFWRLKCVKKRLKGTSKRELMSYGASVLGSLGPSVLWGANVLGGANVLTGLMSWGSRCLGGLRSYNLDSARCVVHLQQIWSTNKGTLAISGETLWLDNCQLICLS